MRLSLTPDQIDALTAECRNLRCDDCAFTPGTSANTYMWTKLKADLCVMGLDEFHCHKVKDSVCRGYAEAVLLAQRDGQYSEANLWKIKAARRMLDVLQRREACQTDAEVNSVDWFAEIRRAVLGAENVEQAS